MGNRIYLLYLPTLGLFGIAVALFFRFTAEDAFITYRYAENLATLGSLVFNDGEPILALTSPLHGLVSTGLYLVTGHTVMANKVLGLAMLLGTVILVLLRYRNQPPVQTLAAALILLPASVVLWTFGGLETPVLLILVTATTLLAANSSTPSLRRLSAVFLLAGLAFLTRFDSLLFLAPVLLYMTVRARGLRDIAIALAAGAVLPAAWLLTSLVYYGDIFPTSFYAKTPSVSIQTIIGNGKYILLYLILVGIVPMLILALAIMNRWHTIIETLLPHIKSMWWLYLGIAAQILYGLTMAQTHMMFSFRYFVPYIPAFTILVADLMAKAMRARQLSGHRQTSIITAAVLGLVVFQVIQVHYTYHTSVNGLSPWGEYRYTGVKHYVQFIETLKQEGENIREHWDSILTAQERLPRIFTYAGGSVPYTFRESYVYEYLVSYRHCPPENPVRAYNVWMHMATDPRLSADYIHILSPRHGPVADQLPLPEEHFALISTLESDFDGNRESFLVYHNPDPAPHTLTRQLHGRCEGMAQDR